MSEARYRVVNAKQFATMVLAGTARLPWMPSDGGVPLYAGWTVEQTVADFLDDAGDYGWYCIGRRADGLYHILGNDGGEPEDQLLVRDWAWVAPALQDAYNNGLRRAEGIARDYAKRFADQFTSIESGWWNDALKERTEGKLLASESLAELIGSELDNAR